MNLELPSLPNGLGLGLQISGREEFQIENARGLHRQPIMSLLEMSTAQCASKAPPLDIEVDLKWMLIIKAYSLLPPPAGPCLSLLQ
jgi:hypothetical protein